MSSEKPRKAGQKAGAFQNRGGKYQVAADRVDIKAACRALYEGTPGGSCRMVAEKTGVPEGTVRRWKAEDGWKSLRHTMPDLAGRAGELANSFRTKMSELGKPMSDDVAAAEASKELAQEYAVDIRAGVLDRHRKEWAGPRAIIYDAMKSNNFDRAKLGKISAETLQLIQAGECRAFGMNHEARGADGGRTVVLIDRGAEDAEPTGGVELPPVDDELGLGIAPVGPAATPAATPAAAPAADAGGSSDSDDEEF